MGSKTSFSDLLNNKSFMKKIVCLEDKEEVIDAFKKEGVIPTEEEMKTLKKKFTVACAYIANCSKEEIKKLQEKGDDLTDEDLLNVSGGFSFSDISLSDALDVAGRVCGGVKDLTKYVFNFKQAEKEAEKAEAEAKAKLKIKQMESNTQIFAVGATALIALLWLLRDNKGSHKS